MAQAGTASARAAATHGGKRREIYTPGGRGLREHAARGTLVNSAFEAGLAGVGLLRRLVVAAFLTRSEFGLWGILVATLTTLVWLKQIGVSDKYIQQSERDQEHAFQKAFTLELAYSLGFFVLAAALLPAYAAAYSRPEIILPGIVLALTVPLSALETPIWIAYRRMQYARQRALESIDPVVSLAATVGLAVAGCGYWSLIGGALAGALAGGSAALLSSPYRIRLRLELSTVREYWRFSWPLLGLSVSNLLVVQGSMLVGNRTVGLAGLGAIGFATTLSSFAERLDEIVSRTIYPAVCAVADQRKKLFEVFVKSNRLALIWGMPFGVGLALFAGDLIHFAFGERWAAAVPVVAAYGLMAGLRQVGFNYSIFMRAVNDTKPMLAGSLVNLATFVVVGLPLMFAFGLTGYVLAFAAMTAVQLAVRGWFLARLFSGFQMVRHFGRAIAPSVPAAAAILALRALVAPPQLLWVAAAELALYVALTAAATWWFERALIREVISYLRRRREEPAAVEPAPPVAVPAGT